MLILSRRETESICLGDDIEITVVAVGSDKVRIGVKAPPEVRVLRGELEVREQTIPFPGSTPLKVSKDPMTGRYAPMLNSPRKAA